MANGFRITCTASSYSSKDFSCIKGWCVELASDDPLYLKLKGEAAFKSEPCIVRDPVGAIASTTNSVPPKPSEADDITSVEALGAALLQALYEGGYTTVGEVIFAGQEKLTEISGIGKATAGKILAACEGYLAE